MRRSQKGEAGLFQRIGVVHPIIQAPMGGGPTTPDLVAAVANAGALGSIAGGYLEPEQLRECIDEVRRRTDAPFAVNLFAGGGTPEEEDASAKEDASPMLLELERWHDSLGLPPPEVPELSPDLFDEKIEVIFATGVAAFSFTFGIPEAGTLAELRRRGVVVMGTATTVEEARMLEGAGVDGVVAQGSEAGAHRGTFAADPDGAMIGSMALIPQVVDAVGVPVIASGGIMDGRGIMAALALGAAGVQMGSAFLVTREAKIPEAYRRRLLRAREDETVLTRAFSGKPARGIRNAFISDIEGSGAPIPPYPLQNNLTRSLRGAAAARGNPEALSLWAGQGVPLAREGSATDLVSRLVDECSSVLSLSQSSSNALGAPSSPIHPLRWLQRDFSFGLPVGMFPMVLERLAGTPARAEALVARVPEKVLSSRMDDRWSIKEHIAHLCDLGTLDRMRLQDFLDGAAVLSAADMTNRKTWEANHNEVPMPTVLERFRQERAWLVQQLAPLSEEQVLMATRHPRLQRALRLIDWALFVAEHDDHHLAHARAELQKG